MGKTFTEVLQDNTPFTLSAEGKSFSNVLQLKKNIHTSLSSNSATARLFNEINASSLEHIKKLVTNIQPLYETKGYEGIVKWFDQAIMAVYGDLFDLQGNVHPPLAKIFIEAGLTAEKLESKSFKEELIKDYSTNIIGFFAQPLFEKVIKKVQPHPEDPTMLVEPISIYSRAATDSMKTQIPNALQHFPSLPEALSAIQNFAQNHPKSTGCKQITTVIDKILANRNFAELTPVEAGTLLQDIKKIAENRLDKYFITSMTRESSTHQFFKTLVNPELTAGSLNPLTTNIQHLSQNYNDTSRLSKWLNKESKKAEKYQTPTLQGEAKLSNSSPNNQQDTLPNQHTTTTKQTDNEPSTNSTSGNSNQWIPSRMPSRH